MRERVTPRVKKKEAYCHSNQNDGITPEAQTEVTAAITHTHTHTHTHRQSSILIVLRIMMQLRFLLTSWEGL